MRYLKLIKQYWLLTKVEIKTGSKINKILERIALMINIFIVNEIFNLIKAPRYLSCDTRKSFIRKLTRFSFAKCSLCLFYRGFALGQVLAFSSWAIVTKII